MDLFAVENEGTEATKSIRSSSYLLLYLHANRVLRCPRSFFRFINKRQMSDVLCFMSYYWVMYDPFWSIIFPCLSGSSAIFPKFLGFANKILFCIGAFFCYLFDWIFYREEKFLPNGTDNNHTRQYPKSMEDKVKRPNQMSTIRFWYIRFRIIQESCHMIKNLITQYRTSKYFLEPLYVYWGIRDVAMFFQIEWISWMNANLSDNEK